MDTTKLKTYFWFLLNLVLASIFVNIVFAVMPAVSKLGNSFTPARVITVSASGKAFIVPDVAEVSFSVVSRGQDPAALADENNRKVNAVIDFVKTKNITAEEIQTAGYNLSPDYRYYPDTGRGPITSYTLTQTVRIRIRDFATISPILGGLPPLGINQISGPNFTVDDPEEFLGSARAEAFEKARAKAQTMAVQNGVSLGKVLNVSEYGGVPPVPYYARSAEMGLGDADVALPTIEPGQQELNVQVTVTYELR